MFVQITLLVFLNEGERYDKLSDLTAPQKMDIVLQEVGYYSTFRNVLLHELHRSGNLFTNRGKDLVSTGADQLDDDIVKELQESGQATSDDENVPHITLNAWKGESGMEKIGVAHKVSKKYREAAVAFAKCGNILKAAKM
jgi:hypothetical protein